jgi:hypothetical protein
VKALAKICIHLLTEGLVRAWIVALCKTTSLKPLGFSKFCEVCHTLLHLIVTTFYSCLQMVCEVCPLMISSIIHFG